MANTQQLTNRLQKKGLADTARTEQAKNNIVQAVMGPTSLSKYEARALTKRTELWAQETKGVRNYHDTNSVPVVNTGRMYQLLPLTNDYKLGDITGGTLNVLAFRLNLQIQRNVNAKGQLRFIKVYVGQYKGSLDKTQTYDSTDLFPDIFKEIGPWTSKPGYVFQNYDIYHSKTYQLRYEASDTEVNQGLALTYTDSIEKESPQHKFLPITVRNWRTADGSILKRTINPFFITAISNVPTDEDPLLNWAVEIIYTC